jgi:GTP cyclohydrolase I
MVDRAAAARAIDAFLIAIGRDPAREPELKGTGARVADAFIDELCTGYDVDTDAMLRANLIESSAEASIVELRDIAVTTMCPHHLMVGTGKATIGFRPRAHILGVGAMARVVDAFARRLTLQEAIGEGVVSAIERNVHPRWVACRIEMTHMCMTARGERAHGARLVTFAMRGEDDRARDEAIRFVKEE